MPAALAGRDPLHVKAEPDRFVAFAFAAALQAMLDGRKWLKTCLLIEITESSAITRIDEVGRFVRALREQGFRICLDDFGAGASSFHYLHAFAVDFVKIDGRFVKQAMTEARDATFLKAMAGLCHELGTAVIAEMVETEAQRANLRRLGVEFGQGYLFGKPSEILAPAALSATPARARLNLERRGAVESWG